ncbi:hypothetical protein K7472_17475 [Streptomyces sp. PTM05]|uniref:Uncharacterized protein n=1 Tax=Streptantibioticus parmotrematis TaxID=2873249 RepID=A0ABS7QTX0_9ACTN|nr:hypothetical protein [Streptantibioticus parmotrematis]
MRAPQHTGAWNWDLEEHFAPGLGSALTTAARMVEVLREHGLMHRAEGLRWGWFTKGIGGLGITTEFSLLNRTLDDKDLPRRILGCRPEEFPEAEILGIFVLGRGTYIDASGREHSEDGLVGLIMHPAEDGLSAVLEVYHDVWADYDFFGRPHPQVYGHNAPRLSAALRDLDALLGVPADPGESTYFGVTEGYGLARTEPDELIDGLGLDRSDKL